MFTWLDNGTMQVEGILMNGKQAKRVRKAAKEMGVSYKKLKKKFKSLSSKGKELHTQIFREKGLGQ